MGSLLFCQVRLTIFFRLSADNGIVVGRKGGGLFIMMVENAFDKRQ